MKAEEIEKAAEDDEETARFMAATLLWAERQGMSVRCRWESPEELLEEDEDDEYVATVCAAARQSPRRNR